MSDAVSDLGAGRIVLGNGAQFWAYISPANDTAKWVTKWEVTLSQGNWKDQITSANPYVTLQTPKLSGIFQVQVYGSGPNFQWQQIPVGSGYQADIGCNSNCAAMVGIVADPGGGGATYWTTWDAICSRG